MTQRDEKKQRTEARIVETAGRCFSQHGFSGTNTLLVAHEAGVAHGTLFVHFATREALIARVVDQFCTNLSDALHQEVQRGADLRGLLQAHLVVLARFEGMYAAVLREGSLLPENVRAHIIGIQSAFSLHLAEALEQEKTNANIRELPMSLLGNTWIALVNYYVMNRDLFAPEGSVIAAKGPELLAYFMRLVLPPVESVAAVETEHGIVTTNS